MAIWPELCPTCKAAYSRETTFCSNGFHCCRDCTWLDGQRTTKCQACATEDLEEMKQGLRDGTVRIVSANEDKISKYCKEVQILLKTIATQLDEPGMAHAFVTDESLIWDFGVSEGECVALSETLGILVSRRDYLWEIAARMLPEAKN